MPTLLVPFYLLYMLGSHVKNLFFQLNLLISRRAPLPAVSVGNISFGGSNKTPLAAHLVTFLRKHGYNPALVSRGYKGRWEKKGGILSDGKNLYGDWKDAGDEPFMLATAMKGLGVFTGKNRLFSCQKARELGFTIAVLDDGFQHRRLQKDIDIVLWSPEEKIALRESSRSLKRADILLVEKGQEEAAKNIIRRKAFSARFFVYSVVCQGLFSLRDQISFPLSLAREKRILAVSGIARAGRFFSLLQQQGLTLLATLAFPDHTSYPPRKVKKILRKSYELRAEVLITTQKDAVKFKDIKELEKLDIYYLRIGLDIDEGFEKEVLRLLQAKSQNT